MPSGCPKECEPARTSPGSLAGTNFADLVRIATREGWPGYLGAPRLATAAMGVQEFALSSQNLNAMALQILDGLDPRKIPRYADDGPA